MKKILVTVLVSYILFVVIGLVGVIQENICRGNRILSMTETEVFEYIETSEVEMTLADKYECVCK